MMVETMSLLSLLPVVCSERVTAGSQGRGTQLKSVCCFLCCKNSHHGQFQATNVMTLNPELGRNAQQPTVI